MKIIEKQGIYQIPKVTGSVVNSFQYEDQESNAPSLKLARHMTGIPTNGVIEYDGEEIPEGYEEFIEEEEETIVITNENGTAIKYPNGRMECMHIIAGNSFNCTTASSGRYYFTDSNNSAENVKTWTFPVPFISADDIIVNVIVRSNAYTCSSLGPMTTDYATAYCITPYSVASTRFHWHFIAKGRWK